jgi:flagellar hook-length control protein FliK
VRDGKTEARLTLHPADLGPIDVRIRVEEGAASLQFDARHPETRQAIEAALPRLREMLADGGLQLGGAQIGHRNGGQSGEAPPGPAAAPAATASDPEATAVVERTVIIPARGRVDLYA